MAQRDLYADPYHDSGRSAAQQGLLRMKCELLKSSIVDANELERRAHGLIQRSAKLTWVAFAVMAASALIGSGFGATASSSYDGTYEGAVLANWSMLGCVVCLGGLSFASSWYSNVRRLRETGRRLLTRAEYQRRRTTLQLSEIEHEAVR